jgi:hypothetical protein
MTPQETASAMRRVADVVEKIGSGSIAKFPKSILDGEAAVGAAGFLCYLRDCLTGSPKEIWKREELLVLLERMSCDGEIFPVGTGRVMWQMDNEEIDQTEIDT